VSLYVLACNIFANFPFELKKVAGNSIDAAHSISRNISEGYCRRSLKEYLNYLNIMLRPATHIRYHITAILAVHWLQFVAQYKRWIRPQGPGYWNTGMMQISDNRDDISFLTTIPEFQHSTIPCGRHKTSVVKSFMISIYYRNLETYN